MYATIERFEGEFAICEINGEIVVSIERTFVPQEAKVGSTFVLGEPITSALQATLRQNKVMD
jgi:hypothetical protein